MKKILFPIIVFLIIGMPLVYGHPYTLETDPAKFSNAPTGITSVSVFYSEGIELEFSSLKVYDSNGEQVDNRDTAYLSGEESLIVTTPPLEDGVYTVASKVLSKVDGHLVPSAFVFAVGDVKIDQSLLEQDAPTELIFLPEAGARLPGIVGQTIVLGAVISSILIWSTQRKDLISDKLETIQNIYHGKFMSITGIGLIIVFASNILMLLVQTLRLETSAFEVLQTNFGSTWLIRMSITIALLGIWFVMEKQKRLSIKNQIPLLIVSLALISTTTMLGHGAATEQIPAIILDYAHNLVAAVWIGGVIFFGFILLPVFSKLDEDKKERMSLLSIPRFSMMFIIAIGIVIITGPTLMWFLESDVGIITESTYGKLIITKIILAAGMIGIGGFNQYGIQKKAEKNLKANKLHVQKKLKRSLKIESGLGIALLVVVALLANGTLPAGEIQKVDAQEITYGFNTIEFSENAKFDVNIFPFTTGNNKISVAATDLQNNPIYDLSSLKIKVSNAEKAITPIEIPITEITDGEGNVVEYQSEATFGFSGNWQVEVEVQRTENANESVLLDLLAKPRLDNLQIKVTEFDLPKKSAKPLDLVSDGHGGIWISDPSKPRIWEFSIDDERFEAFEFDGSTSVFLSIDNLGNIWFVDPPENQIGWIDSQTKEIQLIDVPTEGRPFGITVDFDNNVWLAILTDHILVKFDQKTGTFEEFILPTEEAGPFALETDPEGNVWFTETLSGKIGMINPNTGEIKEYEANPPLSAPESLLFDDKGNVWIGEHTGISLAKFNPTLETFERIPVPDPNSLPFGMTFDKFKNIWFAQHQTDNLGVYDPHNNDLIEIPIPTENSWAQFTTSDENKNIWFVEQEGNKLGMVQITEIPNLTTIEEPVGSSDIQYTELASPLISLGIIATSLFFVKSVRDKRRINSLV